MNTVISEPEIRNLSGRNRLITFDDGISLLLITGRVKQILCDTHLGPASIDAIRGWLIRSAGDLLIFNSHADWDHIWGNGAFATETIISHEECRERMIERGAFDLSRLNHLTRGRVNLRLPNLTFDQRLTLPDEQVVFLYAPGHTRDSAVCYDREDQVLYLGDLVEDPIPYLDDPDLDRYIRTLKNIRDIPAQILVTAHSGVIDRSLIDSNIRYIEQIRDGNVTDAPRSGPYAQVHRLNLNMMQMFAYERRAKEILKEQYNFASFWSEIPDFAETGERELVERMDTYLQTLVRQRGEG